MKYILISIGIILMLPVVSFFFWFIVSMICLKIDEINEMWKHHKETQRKRLQDKLRSKYL
jgi:hypothetical protein